MESSNRTEQTDYTMRSFGICALTQCPWCHQTRGLGWAFDPGRRNV